MATAGAASLGPQQAPDSTYPIDSTPQQAVNSTNDSTNLNSQSTVTTTAHTTTTNAFPTDAKEKAKAKKKQLKEKGITIEVKKRHKVVEEHYDDCGDDLSSLQEDTMHGLVRRCDFDSENELSDQDHEDCLYLDIPWRWWAFPIDVSRVAKAQPGVPVPGRDPRAKPPGESNCPGCKHYRSRDDWEHNRVIGECSYPHDEPVIPECEACQRRVARYAAGHTYEVGKCRWAAAQIRTRGGRVREPQPQAHAEPTAGAPAQIDGRELGDEGER
jgi:hypothetical protein